MVWLEEFLFLIPRIQVCSPKLSLFIDGTFSRNLQLLLYLFSLGRPLTPKVASLWYRAPELLLGCSIYDNAIDNWAAGLIVAELLTGEPIIKGHHEIDQIQRMFILLGEPNLTIWPGLKDMPMFQDNAVKFSMKCEVPLQEPTARFFDLLKPFVTSASGVLFLQSLLMYDPFQRVTAKEALKSSYFVDHPIPTSPRLMPTFRSKHH